MYHFFIKFIFINFFSSVHLPTVTKKSEKKSTFPATTRRRNAKNSMKMDIVPTVHVASSFTSLTSTPLFFFLLSNNLPLGKTKSRTNVFPVLKSTPIWSSWAMSAISGTKTPKASFGCTRVAEDWESSNR